MHQHPLQDLPYCRSDSDYDDVDAYSEATTEITEDDRLTVSTRKSQLSLDVDQSISDLNVQVKMVPLRFINKPDFDRQMDMYLVQEKFVQFPVYCIKCSPDGQYLAVAGGEVEGRKGGGTLLVYPLLTIRVTKEHAEDDLYAPPMTCDVFDVERATELQPCSGAILDVCWTSKSRLLFTAGMDKQATLWSLSMPGIPLMVFPHPDVVSSIAVHPKDDRVIASGCIDGRLRLWSAEHAKVLTSVDLPHPITAVCFTQNGHSVVAGTVSGHLYIYGIDGSGSFKYHSQIHVRSRRGRNASGTAKVSGLQSMQSPNGDPMVLCTTNDSRVRLYRLRDREVKFKFHGIINEDSQLQAVIQENIVCCASEDGRVGLWKVPDMSNSIFLSIAEKIRGRLLVDSLVSFRAALGKVSNSEDLLRPGQPLSTAILLPLHIYDMLVAARLRLSSKTFRPIHIATGDMTGRVKIFEWGSDLSLFTQSKE